MLTFLFILCIVNIRVGCVCCVNNNNGIYVTKEKVVTSQSRCQMILILILDLAHRLHYWMTMSHPQQLKNQWLMVHMDDNNGNKKT